MQDLVDGCVYIKGLAGSPVHSCGVRLESIVWSRFDMLRRLFVSCLLIAPVSAMNAQEPWQDWQTKWSGDAAIVVAPGAEGALVGDSEDILFAAKLRFDADRVLESGVEIGTRITVEAQKDHPGRAGFNASVPFSGGLQPTARRSQYSGFTAGAPVEDAGTRAEVETAFIFVKGGYGEARLGRDLGVASRFQEGAPSVFGHAKLDSASLDPTGSSLVRTDHDLTGPSAKVTVTSPRLLGVRGGVSFTPKSEARGLDRYVNSSRGLDDDISIENAVEVAVNVSRRLPKSGVRLRAGAAISRGDINAPPSLNRVYDQIETWSLGASAEFDTVTVGGSVLGSNNGVNGSSGDYSAWSAGVTKEFAGVTVGAEYGVAEDELANIETESWSIGASKAFTERFSGAIGYQSHMLDRPRFQAPSILQNSETAQGIVVEITLSL